jgi:hypothetical protein
MSLWWGEVTRQWKQSITYIVVSGLMVKDGKGYMSQSSVDGAR